MKPVTASQFYKNLFGTKVYKISLESGCTCPNRDGTKGTGGCIFCSEKGSGDFTSDGTKTISLQLQQAKQIVEAKFPKNTEKKYIAYFQSFTNTYGNLLELKQKWEQALEDDAVVGLALATRPDCISSDLLEYLAELSQKVFVQLELGLQTASDQTAKLINRCYETESYKQAAAQIKKACPKVHLVTHVIFGLPGESEKDMMASVQTAVAAKTDGLKITVLYVLKGTKLEQMFWEGKFQTLEMAEYLRLIEIALKKIPSSVVIHRLTGDPPKSLIVSPMWTCNKKKVLSEINRILGV